jgi:hypothetical protein
VPCTVARPVRATPNSWRHVLAWVLPPSLANGETSADLCILSHMNNSCLEGVAIGRLVLSYLISTHDHSHLFYIDSIILIYTYCYVHIYVYVLLFPS